MEDTEEQIQQQPTEPAFEAAPEAPAAPAQPIPPQPLQLQVREARVYPDKPDNTIYVGKKNVMSYVLAVVTLFNNGTPEVHVKARGKAISRAVDVTQIVKNRFISGLVIRDVRFTTEELQSEDGSMNKVSSMEVAMTAR